MHIYPSDERGISDVERGRRCEAVVSLAPGESLQAGDTVLFALSTSRAGQQPCFVKGGDSVLVSLTGATDLGATDPATGQPLVRIAWEPYGLHESPVRPSARGTKARRPPRVT